MVTQVTQTMQRYKDHARLVSQLDIIQKKRLLIVGAGGIGCELLKNLAMMGFSDLEVVGFVE
jgi:molybdopterin/thiamine biosynthesis adenylyltransferase